MFSRFAVGPLTQGENVRLSKHTKANRSVISASDSLHSVGFSCICFEFVWQLNLECFYLSVDASFMLFDCIRFRRGLFRWREPKE